MVLKLMKGELHRSCKARRMKELGNLTKLYDVRCLLSGSYLANTHKGIKSSGTHCFEQTGNRLTIQNRCTISTHPF